MRRHLNYLKYVLRHKWFILCASRKIGASLWLALIHDVSKFRPSEWTPYARTFYKPDGSKQFNETPAYRRAWLLHLHRNPHHWQYWMIINQENSTTAIEMPHKYALEMVADWMGAGRAISGRWEYLEWYTKNREKIVLHDNTRHFVEEILGIAVSEKMPE